MPYDGADDVPARYGLRPRPSRRILDDRGQRGSPETRGNKGDKISRVREQPQRPQTWANEQRQRAPPSLETPAADHSNHRKTHDTELLGPEPAAPIAILPRETTPSALPQPSLVIGTISGADLTTAQLASRHHRQWTAITQHHTAHHPAAAPLVAEQRWLAARARRQLPDTPESHTPRSRLPEAARAALARREDLLHQALAASSFPPERANILAALEAYETGRIGCSAEYTLIFAGKVVDTCLSYESFTADRRERLDRYAAEHGPGWLWYEPPLLAEAGEGGGGARVLARRGTALRMVKSRRGPAAVGMFRVTMGFRRALGMVARGKVRGGVGRRVQFVGAPAPVSPTAGKKRKHSEDVSPKAPSPKRRRSSAGLGAPHRPAADKRPVTDTPVAVLPSARRGSVITSLHDPCAPHLFFSMLLDSGADIPTLFAADLAQLGIDPARHAAQTIVTMDTMNGGIPVRLYDLAVGVYASEAPDTPFGCAQQPLPASLVDPDSSGSSTRVPDNSLGCITPVVMLPPGQHPPAFGQFSSSRLSGMLPFLACYVSSAPGAETLWLGADRADVLGAQRVPGQARWPPRARGAEEAGGAAGPRHLWGRLGNPVRVVFEHDMEGGGRLLDEDVRDKPGTSVVSVVEADGRRERWTVDRQGAASGNVKGARSGGKGRAGKGKQQVVVEETAMVVHGEREKGDVSLEAERDPPPCTVS